MIGDLGTGKTTFTKGLAKALKVEDHITSPTFVLMKQYNLEDFKGKLSHIDCYRMQSIKDAEGIGVLELFQKNEGIVVLEWADKIDEILPDRTVKIQFKSNDETKGISVKGLKCKSV